MLASLHSRKHTKRWGLQDYPERRHLKLLGENQWLMSGHIDRRSYTAHREESNVGPDAWTYDMLHSLWSCGKTGQRNQSRGYPELVVEWESTEAQCEKSREVPWARGSEEIPQGEGARARWIQHHVCWADWGKWRATASGKETKKDEGKWRRLATAALIMGPAPAPAFPGVGAAPEELLPCLWPCLLRTKMRVSGFSSANIR